MANIVEELSSSPTLVTLLVSVISLVTLLKLKAHFTASASLNLPPSPRISLPILGHLYLLHGHLLHHTLQKLANRYGPLFHLRLGSLPAIVVSSPSVAAELFKSHDHAILGRPYLSASEILGSDGFVMAQPGPLWRTFKKLSVTELLGPRSLARHQPIRRQEINSLLLSISEAAASGSSVHLGERLEALTGNVVSRMAMNKSMEEAEEWWNLVKEGIDLGSNFYLGDLLGFAGKRLDLWGIQKRCDAMRRRFDELTEQILREHEERRKMIKAIGEEREDREDIVDVLLSAVEDNKEEVKLSRESIKGFLRDIYGAGMDTTNLTMQWALAEVIRHPTILEKAQKEIDSVVGRDRVVQESDIANLPCLRAIIKETLRLHPVGPLFLRRTTEEFKLGSYNIGTNWWVIVNAWAIGRDPTVWDHPLEFRPERFSGSTVDVKGQHFELLPFGSGRRLCPGNTLALHLLHTAIGGIVQCFDWEVDGGAEGINMEEGSGMTVPMAHPLICRPILRCNPFVQGAREGGV